MMKQYMTDQAVIETRAAVQAELRCAECEVREINRRVGSQPGTDEDAYELEGFVTAEVQSEIKNAEEKARPYAEWIECAEPCRHLSAATRYANFRAKGLQSDVSSAHWNCGVADSNWVGWWADNLSFASQALARLMAASGLYLPSPTSKGIVRPLVKSSFTTTLALELPRATVHQLRSAFEFSPFTLCRSYYEPGPLEDNQYSRPAIKLGPAVKDCGRLVQFLKKWHFGSPTMVIGPAEFLAGGGDERAGVALMGGDREAFRPRWIVAATQDN